jgi:hypothetical protein
MATVSLGIVIDTANNSIIATDTSDYAGQGISTADVVGNVEVLIDGVQWYVNSDYTRYSDIVQGASSTTVQLNSGASSINGFYQGLWVNITSGTGAGQQRQVISYSGTTKTCVVAAWGTNPVGATYEFAFADIYVAASLNNQRRIALPLQNGVIRQGVYTFNYTVYDQATDNYYSASSTININFTFPTVNLTYNVDCVTPLLQSTDSTDYTIQGATETVTRTHTVAAPPNVDNNVYTGNDITILVPQFYAPTTYQATLSSIVVWDFGGGISVSGLLTGSQPIATFCDNWICDMFCCIKNLYQQWVSLQGTNSGQADYYYNKWQLGVLLIDMIKSAYQCGQNTIVNSLINQFYIETGCTANCNCSDNTTPTLVQGLGLANATQYSLAAADSYVQVTTTTGANSVAWTVGLSPAALALLAGNPSIAGLVNITVANPSAGVYEITGATVTAGNGVSVTTTSSGGVVVDYKVRLSNVLTENASSAPTTGTSNQTLRTYTLAAGVLDTAGDYIEIDTIYQVTPNNSSKLANITIASNSVLSNNANIATVSAIALNVKLIRVTDTSMAIIGKTQRLGVFGGVVDSLQSTVLATVAVNDLDSATNVINFDADGTAIGDMNCFYNSIVLYKK